MAKEKLTLVPSEKMDTNKKPDRNEDSLIRMSAVARQHMGFDKKVEVHVDTTSAEKRMKSSMLLDIFQAFADDIKALKAQGYTADDLKKVGFVTTKTFRRITGSQAKTPKKNIWISDEPDHTVVGADPEFLLFDKNGKIVRANNVLAHVGDLGCDGAMAEIRPKPAISPADLVTNMKAVFTDSKHIGKIKDFLWMAGCYYRDQVRDYPIGGHIHIGNPVQVAQMSTSDREVIFKVINKILDELIAIPMVKIDGAELGRARRTECSMGKYGYFGEWRMCNGRLEYRTLSGMWLMHPKLAECVVGATKAVTDECFRMLADKNYSTTFALPQKHRNASLWHPGFSGWSESQMAKAMGCVRPSSEMIEWLHTSSATNITLAYLRKWYSAMKKLSTYKKYSAQIDGLFEILKNNTKAFHDYDKEIQSNWLKGRPFIGE
jgi:hypothetical protein